MKSHESKLYLLQNHTHWGHLLWRARYGQDTGVSRHFAKTLWRRISYLLRGKPDPLWTREEKERFLVNPDQDRLRSSRAVRLIEILKTVDGLFLQRFLSFPEELWDWNKYDKFVVQAISYLIGDEFFDGEVTEQGLQHGTFYAELKAARKWFKLVIHQDKPVDHLVLPEKPRWVHSFLGATWKYAARMHGHQRAFLAGTLSQTRGSGTPPPTVVLRSKEKFLASISEEPPEFTRTDAALVNAAMDKALGRMPKGIYTGLDTKARVTVTGSACWEETRKEGGTAQAILQLMSTFDDEHLIPVRDMENGDVVEWKSKHDFESIGTAIFYACLQSVLDTSPDELGNVFLTIVKEPGKARSVTKGMACLKIVLDTISKICSYPLKKGFKSSESGMGKSHHGWNLFKDMCSEEMADDLFFEDKSLRVETTFADYLERQVTWTDIFAGSTDYQEATDRMIHSFAQIVATKWMKKCGIPPLLQGIVRRICYRPRNIYFTGSGTLKKFGRSVDESINLRVITLKRGVLMGDPLTKVTLHFSNIVARELGASLSDGSIFTRFRNGEVARETYRKVISDASS